jgi:multiple sugar transport system substrate-binding protein
MIRVIAAYLLAAAALCGCARDRTPPGRVEVDVWSGWTGAEGASFQSLVDEFNRTHPTIFVHNLGGVTDSTKIVRAITAGAPPDIFTIWNAADVGPMAHYGAISDLSAPFRASGLTPAAFVHGAFKLCHDGDRLIGLPLLMDTNALLWNKSAFKEAGLDPNRPPRTLQELMDYARKLTRRDAKGNITQLGMQLPSSTLLCWLFGGDFLDANTGAATADLPENVAAFRYYRDLVKAMGGHESVQAFGSGFGQGQGPNNPFFVGKVAMMISGEWIPSWVEKYAPSLAYGVAAVPYDAAHPQRKGATLIAVNLLSIPSEAKHPAQAWQFLQWLQRPEVQVRFAQALNNVPNIRAALDDPALTTGSVRRQNFGTFCRIAQNPNARGFPVTSVSQFYQDELGRATEFVLYGTKDPGRALADVQAKVSAEMESKR